MPTTSSDRPTTARARARADLTARIKDTARRHLAQQGAQGLSLRAVARDLGLASSAIYRYYANRDDLLTALIIDAYDAVGDAAERADARAIADGADPGSRWLQVCRAVRSWALANPHEFGLVYGTPVVGYAAPVDTVEPATRIARVLARVTADGVADGTIEPPARPLAGPRLVEPGVLELAGGVPEPPYEDVIERSLTMWITLIGAIGFELGGHLHDVATDTAAFFDAAMVVAGSGAGLVVPQDLPRPRAPRRSRRRTADAGR
jgi:AcrR family transcriptional regulator